jgi:hypothetical protein
MAEEKEERVEFVPPKGFNVPEHEGTDFDLVCTFRVKEGGEICLTKLGDTAMPGYGSKDDKVEDKSKSESKPNYSTFASEMAGAMGGGGAAGGGGY